jgi:hypothetical protein
VAVVVVEPVVFFRVVAINLDLALPVVGVGLVTKTIFQSLRVDHIL